MYINFIVTFKAMKFPFDLTQYASFDDLVKVFAAQSAGGVNYRHLASDLYDRILIDPRTSKPSRTAFIRDVRHIEPPYSICKTDDRVLKGVNDAVGDNYGDRYISMALDVLEALFDYKAPGSVIYYGYGDTNFGVIRNASDGGRDIRNDLRAFSAFYNITRKSYVLGDSSRWPKSILARVDTNRELILALYDIATREEVRLPSAVPLYIDMAVAHTDELEDPVQLVTNEGIHNFIRLAAQRLTRQKTEFYRRFPELDMRGDSKKITSGIKQLIKGRKGI